MDKLIIAVSTIVVVGGGIAFLVNKSQKAKKAMDSDIMEVSAFLKDLQENGVKRDYLDIVKAGV